MIIKLNQININSYNKKADNTNLSRNNVTFAKNPISPTETTQSITTMEMGKKIAIVIGSIITAVLILRNQRVSNALRGMYYKLRKIETIKNEEGKLVPKEGFVTKLFQKMNKIPGMSKLLDEVETLSDRIDAKFFDHNKHFDLDYCRDIYRLNMMIPAEKLKCVNALKNPQEFADVIAACKKSDFRPNDGVMIYGKNQEEKKKLLEYFIAEAKKQDVVVEHISTKDIKIGETISDAFENAQKRYREQQKFTLIVMEDVDFILKENGPTTRGIWNTRTNDCGERGIFTLTTAQDINTLDKSCIRTGRIDFKFNIDEALIKQAETDKLKNVK